MRTLALVGIAGVCLGLQLACGGGSSGYVNEDQFAPQVVEVKGGGQSANAGTEFALPIGARLASGSAAVWLTGSPVHFKYPDGSIRTVAATADGWAMISHPLALATPGTYKIQAANDYMFTGSWFITLTSVAAVPAALQAQPGYPVSTSINTAFAGPFQVKAVDAAGAVVAGLAITFTAPSSGASCTFSGGGTSITLTTDYHGMVQPTLATANGIQGSYAITATAGGLSTSFAVSNL